MKETDSAKIIALYPVAGVVAFEGRCHLIQVTDPRYCKMFSDCVVRGIHVGLANPIISAAKNSERSTYQKFHSILGSGPVSILKEINDGRLLAAIEILNRMNLVELKQRIPYQTALVKEENSLIADQDLAISVFDEIKLFSELILKEKFGFFEERVPNEVWASKSLQGLMNRVMEWFRLEAHVLQRLYDIQVLEKRGAQFSRIMQIYSNQIGQDTSDNEPFVPLDMEEPSKAMIDPQDQWGDNVVHIDFSNDKTS